MQSYGYLVQKLKTTEKLRELPKAVASFGIVTRMDKEQNRRYGIRVLAASRDKIAQQLGKPSGTRFFIRNAPIEWVEADVLEFAKQLQWDIASPNPQFAVRIRKGVASWAVRSGVPPPASSAVVQTGDEKITLQFIEAEVRQPPPKKSQVTPLRSWASVVSAALKTSDDVPSTSQRASSSVTKKRKAEAEPRNKSEPPAAVRQRSVTIVTPAEEKQTESEQQTIAAMLRTLISQVREIQISGLSTQMGHLEGAVAT